MSSCRFCQDILVFQEGKAGGAGQPTEPLLEAKGLYASLWNAQAQYYCRITAPPRNVSTRDIDLHQTEQVDDWPAPRDEAGQFCADGKGALPMIASNRFDFPGESPAGLSSAIFNSLFSVFSQPIRLLLFRSCQSISIFSTQSGFHSRWMACSRLAAVSFGAYLIASVSIAARFSLSSVISWVSCPNTITLLK